MEKSDALIIVDLQNDFCPGGALPVEEADQIVPGINRIIDLFPFVVATKDWHPKNHFSFKVNGGPWPVHCVQGSSGADLHPDLKKDKIRLIVNKGEDPERDTYSDFQESDLEDRLRARGIKRVFVVGLATDYCVKSTALDARKLGFETVVLTDLVRAVNVSPHDGEKALEQLRTAGVKLLSSLDLKPEGT